MAIQTAITGNLENAQRVVIAQCLYTAEHNAPCRGLVTGFKLAQGEKRMDVPKVAQATANDLVDGVDMVDSEDIGLTTTELSTNEVGLKFVLTKKLLRQFNEDVFKVVGVQMGDGMARKLDEDLIALFSGFSNALGADNASILTKWAAGCVAHSKANKFPSPISFVHHPNCIAYLAQQTAAIGMTYYAGILGSLSEDLVRNFWSLKMGGVNFFEDGNIAKIGATDSGYGAIISKSALCYIESQAPTVEREYDQSLRGWEVVVVSDYGVFELDDSYGASCRYEIGSLATTS